MDLILCFGQSSSTVGLWYLYIFRTGCHDVNLLLGYIGTGRWQKILWNLSWVSFPWILIMAMLLQHLKEKTGFWLAEEVPSKSSHK